MPAKHHQPLSRLFIPDIQRIVVEEKIVKSISCSTIERVLEEDALKPWRKRTWIYPRDPKFHEKALPVVNLYNGIYKGKPLGKHDFAISADEKPGIQVLKRLHETEMGFDGRGQRIEHNYQRLPTIAYIAAIDVFRGNVSGLINDKTGIEPFMRLVEQVMTVEPYRSARRVFWIVDNGCSHHPSTFPDRLKQRFKNAIAIMLPVHASWLNKIETYFSIVERKVLTPNDFRTRQEAPSRIKEFEKYYNSTCKPFKWDYTKTDLRNFVERIKILD